MALNDPLDRYLAPQATRSTIDPLDDVVAERQRRAASANLVQSGVSPDVAGKANQLGREFGLPAETVERNLGTVEDLQRVRRARAMMERYPAIGSWGANPRHSAVGRDDLDNLGRVSKAIGAYLGSTSLTKPDNRSLLGKARDVAARGLVRAARGVVGSARNIVDMQEDFDVTADFQRRLLGGTIYDPLQRFLGAYADLQQREIDARPQVQTGSPLADQAVQGLENVLPSATGMVMAAITRNPGAALTFAGVQTQGDAYLQAREQGLNPTQSTLFAVPQTVFEVAGEALPIVKYIEDLNVGSSFFKTLGKQIVAENIGEQFTGHLQDFNEWATFNEGKTFRDFMAERPEAALNIAVAATAASGAQTGIAEGARRGTGRIASVLDNRDKAKQAQVDAEFLNDLADGAAESKVRARDPSAFARFLEMQTEGSSVENLYIPADAVRELYQSSDMDWHDSEDPFFGFDPGMAEQIDQAVATGGDVVVKTSDFATHLAGTPAWDALKDHVRASPDGMSLAEAKEWETAFSDAVNATGEEFAALVEQDRAAMEPRQKLAESMRDKLMLAGFRPDVAMANAELTAARYATRAARMGLEMDGTEADLLEVQQVLPESLAKVQAVDGLDMVIAAMKRGRSERSDALKFGPSLLEFIAKRGGVEDRGGDIESMGGRDWHRGKVGRRRLIREAAQDQPDMLGDTAGNDNTPDALALAAWEAGYFPNTAERPSVDQFLEAVGGELGGNPVFAEDRTGKADEVAAAAEDLRALLDQQGLDADKANAKEIKEAVARYQAQREDGRALDQSFMEGPRGRITFATDGRNIIELFEKRDLSTFIHESGHLYLEELFADAAMSDSVAADRDMVIDWFKANGIAMPEDGSIPTEAHELWARGFERFAMEGRAPSSALRKAFDAFRSWLLTIYKVVDNLRSPISPEVRGVMERLLATDEEIEAATEAQNIRALFTTAQEAGMTDEAFAEYQRAAGEARDEAHDALLYRTMAAIRREKTKAWKDEEAGVRSEVMERVDREPIFRALRLLRTGKLGDGEAQRVKLDRAWLVETYGPDALGLLPKSVPPIYADTGTTNVDMIAEMTGFSSGDEMVRTLMGLEARQKDLRDGGDKRSVRQARIDEDTATAMRERHGDILNDGSIEDEARALIHNDKQGEVIASELRSLARRANKRPTPYAIARRWAAETIASGKVVDAISGSALARYERAARKAGKLAEEAMLAGDVDETYRQKQAQMLNNALIAEGKKAKDAVDTAVARLGKLARRKTIKSIDQGHLDQVHGLLEQVEFRMRSQRSLDRQESFEEWANARQAEGFDVAVPPSFAASLGTTHWSRLSVEQLLGLDDTVKQIVHLGRLKQRLLDGQEQRAFDELVDEAVGAIGQLPPKAPSDLMEPSRWDAIKSRVASMDASLLKMETVFDWLDGDNPNGPFNRVVFRRIAQAQDAEKAMLADYVGRLNDLLKAIPKEHLARWSEKVTAPELLNRETGRPFVFTRDQLVSMALNMGNEGNAAKLAGGYGWNEEAIMAVLNRELSSGDWQYVQGVWDTVDSLWPEISGLEKRLNGVEPEKIVARPLETTIGTLKGGYFPVVYDPRKSIDADMQGQKKAAGLFENIYTRATTPKGFTKTRTNVERPIHLSLGIITRHIGEVIHDITHREAVMDADRFLSDRRVAAAVDATLGPEVRRQFRPWLQHIANEWAVDRRGVSGWDAFAKRLRTNSTMVGMGFRISTVIMQVAGYSNTVERVGAKWVGQGLAASLRNPAAAWEFVSARSSEVRNRMDTLERDIRENVRATLGKTDLLSEARRFAFYGIGMMDRIVVVPTWIGAYNRGIAEGMTEEEAGFFADKAVRQSQGAGAAKDLAAVQRSNEWMRLATMFYSYQSAVYQRFRTLGRDVKGAGVSDVPHLLARSFWLVAVPPLLSELLAGRGPDDDEDWGMWALQQMTFGLLGPIPLARDAANALGSGFGYSFTPAARAIETGINVAKDGLKIVKGEETRRATRNAIDGAGYALGLPTGQLASAVQFIVNVSEGEEDPDGIGEWWEGLTKGKIED